jgi:uncharacterized protein YbjT (DUF2867 family)
MEVLMRVLITGGSGELGVRLSRLLVERGHEVTVASRSARPMRDVAAVEMDLATGAGVESVAGHDTVVHLASDPFGAQQVDVEGTQRLVDAAEAAGVDHLLAISIVGIDNHPYPYYRTKAEMEQIVENGEVPWTILRATQFHSLVPRFLDMLPAVGFVPVPRGVSLQPIDVAVVAERLAELAEAGPSGRVADLGGPEVVPLRQMVKDVLRAKRLRRLVVPMPLPGRLGTALRDGRMLTNPSERGERWTDYVAGIGPARDLVGRLAMLTALIQMATAVWMAVSPATFHSTVAPFGDANDHLFRDVATFTLPLVIGLWIAADRRSWRVPVFAIVAVQNGTHALNHLVDLTATDPAVIGVATFISLVATEALLVWMLIRTLRPEPALAPTALRVAA